MIRDALDPRMVSILDGVRTSITLTFYLASHGIPRSCSTLAITEYVHQDLLKTQYASEVLHPKVPSGNATVNQAYTGLLQMSLHKRL